jgi:hypothetical protein
MNDTANFRANVAASPELQARWHTITEALIDEARNKWGVELTKEDLANSDNSALRLFVLTGEKIGDPLGQMQQTLPALKKAQELRGLRDAITREDHAQHDAAMQELETLAPASRMAKAREMGATFDSATNEGPVSMSAEQKAAALKRLSTLRGSARITEARRLGLT